MGTLALHFHGPLTFTPGPQSLFHSVHANASCIYLWAFESEDGAYRIHYVGQARSFAYRQRQHLAGILGLEYGTFSAADARRGIQTRTWPGTWRDKTADGPGRALAQYEKGPAQVLDYIKALRIFVAPVAGDRALLEHIEGSIGWNLRKRHPEAKSLYPDDNHIGTREMKLGTELLISWDVPIAGLDGSLEI